MNSIYHFILSMIVSIYSCTSLNRVKKKKKPWNQYILLNYIIGFFLEGVTYVELICLLQVRIKQFEYAEDYGWNSLKWILMNVSYFSSNKTNKFFELTCSMWKIMHLLLSVLKKWTLEIIDAFCLHHMRKIMIWQNYRASL